MWRYDVRFNETVDDPVFAMLVKTREGVTIYGVDSSQLDVLRRRYTAGEVIGVRFELSNRLAPGVYYLNCGVRLDHQDRTEFVSRRVDAALLRITDRTPSTVIVGLLDMEAKLVLTAASTAVV